MERTGQYALTNKNKKDYDDQVLNCSSSSSTTTQNVNDNNSTIRFQKYSELFESEVEKANFRQFLKQFENIFSQDRGEKSGRGEEEIKPDTTNLGPPDYVICAPGRINIIGEHIDYHGFSVLPMAIKQSIWMAIKLAPFSSERHQARGRIRLVNTCKTIDRASWQGEHSLEYASKMAVEDHHWKNYFLCAYLGVLAQELLGLESDELLSLSSAESHANNPIHSSNNDDLNLELNKLAAIDVLVHSDLPAASGLSSSSALVCASALATILMLNESRSRNRIDSTTTSTIPLNRMQIANNCSRFEHLIGTQGGGMDQAIIMTAQRDLAKLVQFMPEFKCDNVRLPEDIVWLVSHSGVDYCKAATSGFNTRVLETKIGSAIIAQFYNHNRAPNHHSNPNLEPPAKLGKLRNEFYKDWSTVDLVEYLRNQVFAQFDKDQFTIDEICEVLHLTRDQFKEKFKVDEELMNTIENDLKQLTILPRCEHVFEEADRVIKFKSICDTTTNTVLLGQLMSQSHTSLRDKFQCSHPALDRLVSAALEAGALGSRLTGAGWGGCVVSMVELSKSDTVFERLKELSNFTFITKPESGCQVISLHE